MGLFVGFHEGKGCVIRTSWGEGARNETVSLFLQGKEEIRRTDSYRLWTEKAQSPPLSSQGSLINGRGGPGRRALHQEKGGPGRVVLSRKGKKVSIPRWPREKIENSSSIQKVEGEIFLQEKRGKRAIITALFCLRT